MDRAKLEHAKKYFEYEVRFNSSQFGNEEIVPYLQIALSAIKEKLENKDPIEDAIQYFREESDRYARAPEINGCEMTEEWAFNKEMCDLAIKILEEKCDD